MAEIVIFGGTTEGRKLAEFCAVMKLTACVCVVSGYGEQLLPESKYIKIMVGALGEEELAALLKHESPRLVFDATHPYAAEISRLVTGVCERMCRTGRREEIAEQETCALGSVCKGAPPQMEYVRVLRDELSERNREDGIWVDSIEEAAAVMEQDDRAVLVTTGSRELKKYQVLNKYQERIYARVLPSHEGLAVCEEMGLPGSHILAMQGPFCRELNEALLRQIGAGWLVTKESGSHGGFLEKLMAAKALGVTAVVVGRPVEETGISLTEAFQKVSALTNASVPMFLKEHILPEIREITLIGIGMGSPELMTMEAIVAIRSSEALLGASRMVTAAKAFNGHAECDSVYHPEDVLNWINQRPWLRKIGILLSGDTGFYSGATALQRIFSQGQGEADSGMRVRMLPGISTVSYLCARIGTSWEDVALCSRHGRHTDLLAAVQEHRRVFCLLGGKEPVAEICVQLSARGDPDLRLTVGSWLSYPQERIVSGTPEEIAKMEFGNFCAVLVERIPLERNQSDEG